MYISGCGQVNHVLHNIFQHDRRWIWNFKWMHGWKIWSKGVRQFFSLFTKYKLIFWYKRHLNVFIFYFSIKRGHHKIQRKPLRSMWTPQYIRHTLIGHSLLPLVVYLIIYICSLIIYEYGFHDSCEKHDDDDVSKNDNFSGRNFWRIR